MAEKPIEINVSVDAAGIEYVSCPNCSRSIGVSRLTGTPRIVFHHTDLPGTGTGRCPMTGQPVRNEESRHGPNR